MATTYGSLSAWLTGVGGSFTRSSAAYYTNSSGVLTNATSNAPRFDYDPVALTSKGILLEGSSTNLITYSQALSSWIYSQYITATAASGTAPDGTNTANLITATNTTAVEAGNTFAVAGAGTNFAASVYAKAGTNPYVYVGITWTGVASNQYAGAVFNLSAGTVTQNVQSGTGVVLVSASIAPAGNGWYRCIIVATQPTGVTGDNFFIGLPPSATGNTFAVYGQPPATNGNTIYVWGVQVEALPFASSYIPTTSSTASRAADSFSGISIAAMSAGTLYASASTLYASQAQRVLEIDDGTTNNRASLSLNASAAGEFDLISGGSSEAALTAGSVTAGTAIKLAAAYQANDFALVAGGGTPATSSSGSIPSLSKLQIGADAAGGNNFFGHIQQFGFWNGLRGPNANLQSLT
jgi:hypothetical protein